MDYGINEFDFWNMTLGEITRYIESKKRQEKVEDMKRADFDYILADLIGRSVARLHSSANTMPTIEEVYPSLFKTEEIQQQREEKRNELSAIRFKQFAQSFNQRFNKEEAGNNG